MGDWIDDFVDYTSSLPSPENFRLWSAITAVSGALERRVFGTAGNTIFFPNLFTLLVAPPGIGKTVAISQVRDLWLETKKLQICPDNATSAALVDALMEADRKIMAPNNQLIEYHSLAVAADELGTLVPQHELGFLSIINKLFDNPRSYREKRRTLNQDKDITNPQLTILAGSQPGFMANLFPESAWTMGTTSRMIMIYASKSPPIKLFDVTPLNKGMKQSLVIRLTHMADLIGEVSWTPAAAHKLELWLASGCQPVPEHSKLEHYNPRRILHALKLCTISAISRSGELQIIEDDVTRAIDWLLAAEVDMPGIFRSMKGKSDEQVFMELHSFMWSEFAANGRKPISYTAIYKFLTLYADSWKVEKLIESAEKARYIDRIAGTNSYKPVLKNMHGVE